MCIRDSPGFVTFKCDSDALPEKFILKSTFARTYGWSLGNTKTDALSEHIQQILSYKQSTSAKHLHVWQRDTKIPGTSGFEPGQSVLADQTAPLIAKSIEEKTSTAIIANRHAQAEDLILDVVMVEPDYWFVGYHYAQTKPQRWPGGTPTLSCEEAPVSRAYFKLQEALLWSGIHIQADDVCAEIGSCPGGACQLLLEKGAQVFAVDPAEMDKELLKNEKLTHMRCRGKEIRKKDFKEVKWLFTDVNVAPQYTLDIVSDILTNQHVNKIHGMILTLKLSDLQLAGEIPKWIAAIKQLGFQVVKTRQLAFNRREICLMAVKDRFALRSSRRK